MSEPIVKIYASQDWVEEKLNDNISKSDWSQNDETATDYIKNRTHWEEYVNSIIVPEMAIEFVEGGGEDIIYDPFHINLVAGQTYDVTWNGTVYSCIAYILSGGEVSFIVLGNEFFISGENNTNEPFCYYENGDYSYLSAQSTGNHTISISTVQNIIHKLNPKYLPEGGIGYTETEIQEVTCPAKHQILLPNFPVFNVGETVTIIVDDVEYSLVAFNDGGYATIGDSFEQIMNETGEYGWIIAIGPEGQCQAMSLNQHTFAYTLNNIHTIEAKYLSIIETKIEKIAEVDTSSGRIIEDPSIKKPREGKGIVTVDGISEISNFIDISGNKSEYKIETSSCGIVISNGTIYSVFYQEDGTPEHHVKVEKLLEVVKEENLPESILLEGDAVPAPETAQVGQTVIISEVDENGKPTKWECTDQSVKNVKSYGATGDGTTDDTNAIANAIANCIPGDTLYFPSGVYRVSNVSLKSDMTVRGDGWCSVIKLLDATSDYHGHNNCLSIENVSNIIIRDIKLDGTRETQQSTAASQDARLNGIHIRYASDIMVENVWMYNNGYHGCIMTYASNVVFERCKATDNGFRPIHGHTQIYNCRVSNCLCENNGLGLTGGSGFENDSIFFFGMQYLTISDNIIKSNRRGCITVGSDQDSTDAADIIPSRNVTISGNVCECYEDLAYVPTAESDTGVAKFQSMGIVVHGGKHVLENVSVTGNTIKNAHEAIKIYSQENELCSINAAISGNTIIDCSYGIYAVEVTDITISGNQFLNLAHSLIYADGVERFVLKGNNVNAPGISENNMCKLFNCDGIMIQGNRLVGNCQRAVYVPESNTNVIVKDNVLSGFTAEEVVLNTNGSISGNLYITYDETELKAATDPYVNAGFVRPTLVNPNTSSSLWRYTTPVEITEDDTLYELNTYISIPVEYTDPTAYDASAKNTAIVFLTGTDLTTAVGIANLANGNGDVVFSETCIEGASTNNWGVRISLTAERVKELFPTATHVMMQVETAYADPDNLGGAYYNLNDGHAYVYRVQVGGSQITGDDIELDVTLTVEGKAADAKSVGEAISTKIPSPLTAQVGQLLAVKAVDEHGKPIEWEVVNPVANTSSFELVDRTTGEIYNIYVDNGKLTMEVV